MTKQELIDHIMQINTVATQEFLAQLPVEDLELYLEHLMDIDVTDTAA